MNRDQLCAELGITPEQLADWLKLGLPHQGAKRRPVFDAAAVADWLVERGLYRRPAGTVGTLKDVARHFGVTSRCVGYWKDEGMPWAAGRYDLDAIAAWREERFGTQTEDTQGGDRRGYWETKRARAAALKAELELAALRRELIDVKVATHAIGQHIAAVKAHLEQLPDFVLSLVSLPVATRKKIRERLRAKVRELCESFARSLDDLAAAAEPRGSEDEEE